MWCSLIFRAVAHCLRTLSLVVFDLVRFAFLAAHSRTALAAENFLIPINERHLKMTIKEWGTHYNRGRPHSSLGPGLPEPTQDRVPGERPPTPIARRLPCCEGFRARRVTS